MLRSVYLLFFILFITELSGQNPVMLERYFDYLKTNKDKRELIERIKNYTERVVLLKLKKY